MANQDRIIVTGGSGLLGAVLRGVIPGAEFPSSSDFDVTDRAQLEAYASEGFDLLVHAAAFTSPPRIDEDPLLALETNVVGTANAVRLCAAHGARLVYISTDYVFRGDRGGYQEEDELYPVNKYAWSKLGGECAVRLYDRGLIIRTSFGPDVFPFEKGFVDQWTSRQSVTVVARKIAALVETDLTGVVHVGGKRQTVIDYARGLDPTRDIGELSVKQVGFHVPVDSSLDCARYDGVMGGRLPT